jgi:hypothetical protein
MTIKVKCENILHSEHDSVTEDERISCSVQTYPRWLDSLDR